MRKMLFLDIETAPAKVFSFSLFPKYIPHTAIIEPSRILCVSYRWYDDKTTSFTSEWDDGALGMHEKLYALLDAADVVVAYNGNKFDVPWVEGELTLHELGRPSPFAKIDLYQVWKHHSRSLSNKLDYVAQLLLKGERKIQHEGLDLWIKVLNGDPAARKRFKAYCVKDTTLMVPIYDILRPYVQNHPNMILDESPIGDKELQDDGLIHRCLVCGSSRVYTRGWAFTSIGRQRRYYCPDCGKWMKSKHSVTLGDLRNITG